MSRLAYSWATESRAELKFRQFSCQQHSPRDCYPEKRSTRRHQGVRVPRQLRYMKRGRYVSTSQARRGESSFPPHSIPVAPKPRSALATTPEGRLRWRAPVRRRTELYLAKYPTKPDSDTCMFAGQVANAARTARSGCLTVETIWEALGRQTEDPEVYGYGVEDNRYYAKLREAGRESDAVQREHGDGPYEEYV
ncbi:hypothetical protein C8035_v006873 [Colletotrichum spinosum]|uniref:Uncharacterized protein n=1 Tax=Colletotrichum spinosum TaxID=1347390 RepID=A0A4R8QQN4_9PEZI|nr:hypothetical protein C8035_v006873 [Colletotrichum spinosum]